MSISRLIRPVLVAIKGTLVGLLLIALCAAGADAARRINAESKIAIKSQVQPICDSPQVGPQPAPETPGGSMTPSTRPTTEQQAVLSAVTAPGSHNRIEERLYELSFLSFDVSAYSQSVCSRESTLTLAEATPRSASLCTLVGAVPSGTM